VIVTPATFSMVDFDSERIAALVSEAAGWVGLADGDVRVDVAEEVPLAGAVLASVDPPVLAVQGGAFEDPRHPRRMSTVAVQTVAARLLARAADRRRPGFAEAPPEGELTVAQSDAWDVWAVGRAARRGLDVHQQRWRYRFRNRHGFTDVADRVFDRLWAATELSWSDLVDACAETEGARPPSPPTPGRGR
jgi:hypothetical protein